MVIFILQIIMMVSLGAILFVFARILPRIDDARVDEIRASLSFHHLVSYFEKFDEWFGAIFQKYLRRLRVVILKIDNILGAKLNKIKKDSGKESPVLFPIEKEKKEEEDK